MSKLYALQVLDTDPEELFDRLVSVAADACGVEIGLLNLLDQDRLWSKAASNGSQRYDLPRNQTICEHSLTSISMIEVEDLRLDQRFCNNPLVTCPTGFRFYAGVPLRLIDGACVGTLCVLDKSPYRLSSTQRRILEHLAIAAVRALEARQHSIEAITDARLAQLKLDRLYTATPAILQTTDAHGNLTHVSDHWLAEFGYERSTVIGRLFSEFVLDAGCSLMALPVAQRTSRVRCSDGRLLDMQLLSVTDLDRHGKATSTMTVMENITASLATQAALVHSQSFLERTGLVAGVGGWEIELGSNRVIWSDHISRMHDCEPGHQPTLEEGLGYYAPAAVPVITEALRQAVENQQPWDLELPLISATGRAFWARVVGAVEFQDGVAIRISGAFQDITRRKLLEEQLVQSRHLLEITLESIADAVITTNVEVEIEWMNPVAEQLTGWSRQDACGLPLGVVMPVNDQTLVNPISFAVQRCIQDGHAERLADDATLKGYGGVEFAIQASVAPIRNTNGGVLGSVVVFRNVTDQRRQQKEMQHRATHDTLTGALNRSGLTTFLDDLLEQVRNDAGQFHALLYIDLDRFKIVNDSCGHPVGDSLLREITNLLKVALRGGDIVARLGGDEFCVVLKNCREEQAVEVAERVRTQIDRYRFFHEGSSYRVGASIGVVPIDSRLPTLKLLLQAADVTCYAAKEAGRNCVHLWSASSEIGNDHIRATQWVSRLESALDDGRFELYAQRIESVSGPGTGLRCEVLLRMRERDGSLILPGAFIVAAERFHMAPLLDRWVLRTVLDHLNAHATTDGKIELISVNLSGQSVSDKAFRTEIYNWIRAALFDVSKLCIEITETSAIAHLTDARHFVDEIRSLGVKVALDDFGAGASSFSYLKNLTVDFLKIDGQFVKNLPNDQLDFATVRCFRDVARTIGIRTVAEFVERQDQRDSLSALGIDMVQGYLIHRPEPLHNLLPQPVHR